MERQNIPATGDISSLSSKLDLFNRSAKKYSSDGSLRSQPLGALVVRPEASCISLLSNDMRIMPPSLMRGILLREIGCPQGRPTRPYVSARPGAGFYLINYRAINYMLRQMGCLWTLALGSPYHVKSDSTEAESLAGRLPVAPLGESCDSSPRIAGLRYRLCGGTSSV